MFITHLKRVAKRDNCNSPMTRKGNWSPNMNIIVVMPRRQARKLMEPFSMTTKHQIAWPFREGGNNRPTAFTTV